MTAACVALAAAIAVTLALRGGEEATVPPPQAAALPPLAQSAVQALTPPQPSRRPPAPQLPAPRGVPGPDLPEPPPGAECFRSSPGGECIPVCAREAEVSREPLPLCGGEPPPVRMVPLAR